MLNRTRFQRAISLGNNCQTVFQLRKNFPDDRCPSGIFDMQVTPEEALIEYLERDFRGMFERADLDVDERGIVVNRKYNTRHNHEFPNGLVKSYDNARSRHDYLCQKVRKVLDGWIPTLFVLRHPPGSNVASRVRKLIKRRNRALPFEIATIETGAKPTRLPPNDWLGNDDEWREILSNYTLSAEVPSGLIENVDVQARRFLNHLFAAKF